MTDDTEVLDSPVEAPDPFDMSEEELNSFNPTEGLVQEADEASTEEPEQELEEEGAITSEEDEDLTEEDSEADEAESEELTDTEDPNEDEEDQESVEDDTPEIDYEAEYKKLMAPFKANGREITTSSAEEVIKLKQMGANYTKKMVELKPHLKVTKMLEKNGLLDEGKLNYLIDLSNKDPKAIAQLIKESGIDPLDIDTESTEYSPKNHAISEVEVNLDEVLSQIEATPTYERTIDIVGNKWDDSSKEILSAKPKMIADINDHIANGIYDKIEAEMDKQRMFGGLEGLSDLEAYQKVGSELNAKGAFDEPTPKPVKRSKPKVKQSDAVRKLKKRAASPTKAIPKKNIAKKEINYFDLSEEELNKLSPAYN